MSKRKKRIIGILIVVLLCIVGSIFIFNNHSNYKIKEESNYSEDVYSYVDDIIKNTVKSDNYLNADINEKYKIINKILYSLEKENKILSNSIEYDNENKMFWYNYSDGTEGGIMLENFSEGYSGNANIDDYVIRKDEQGKILSYNCDIDFNGNEYPYTEKEVESLDLKAKFMYGLGYDSILDSYKDYQTIWTKQHLKTDIDDYCTVEDFKSGLLGYNIVFIEEHGCYSNKKIMICTEELTSKKSDSNYKADLKNKRIKKVISSEDNKQYYWINPSFFSFYYKNNELSNTIIWIGSCHGYQCDDLVNVFSRCGVKAVIGYDESVLTGYDCFMLNSFVYSLFYGDSVSEALNFAKNVFGQNDLEYWRTYRGTKSKFGTIAFIPSSKNNCATAKLYPGSKNARLIDSEIMGAIRGGEIKSKTQSTEPVEITEVPTAPITTIPKEANTYNGHSYMVYSESMKWKEAKEYCEKLGGHLVTIFDADEQKFVEDLAEKFTDKTSYWLGGYYSDLEWKWVDGTHFSYTNWDSWTDGTEEYKQPDNHTGNEFYLRFANKKMQYSTWYSNKGKWNDVSNEADGSSGDVPLNSFGFICEWDSIAE